MESAVFRLNVWLHKGTSIPTPLTKCSEQGSNHRQTHRKSSVKYGVHVVGQYMSMTLLLFNTFATACFFFLKRVYRAKGLTSANSHALISSISFSVHTLERGPTCLKSKDLYASNPTVHTCNNY